MAASKPQIDLYFGTIGFSYDGWRNKFYQRRTKVSSYLAYYSLILPAVEIVTTFHADLQTEKLWKSAPDVVHC